MDKQLIKYEAISPVLLSADIGGKPAAFALPEGGLLGFDGIKLYMRNQHDKWVESSTEKIHLADWLEQGIVKRLPNEEKKTSATLPEAYKALQQEGSPAQS